MTCCVGEHPVMWSSAAQSVHSPGPAQNVGSHLTLSFQVSTGWRRRKRSRNSFRNTRRQWGTSTAAFCQVQTAEIRAHMEKDADLKPSHISFPLPLVKSILTYPPANACNYTVTKLFLSTLTSVFPLYTQSTGGVAVRWYSLCCASPLCPCACIDPHLLGTSIV